MSWFANLPIRTKLVLLQVLTAQLVLTLFAALSAFDEWSSIEAREDQQLLTAARLIAVNSVSPLEFMDDQSARTVLASLAVEPLVEQAWLYDVDGEPFARFPPETDDGPELESAAPEQITRRRAGRAQLVQPVTKPSGERVGTLIVRSRPDQLRAALARTAVSFGVTLVLGFVLAGLLAWAFERAISSPILRMERTVRQVAAEGDLSLRVPVDRSDELGQLSHEFNSMIDELESRDRTLRTLQAELEQRVVDRTAELTESEQFLSAVLGTMLDGLIVVTDEGRIREANAAALRTLEGQVIGRQFAEIFDLDAQDTLAALAERTGRITEGTALQSGDRFPIELSVGRSTAGDDSFFTVTFRDISERNRLKEMQRRFLSTVSHELRTPMTAIHGALRLLQSGRLDQIERGPSNVIELAVSNSDRMIKLINDLLDIQRVQNDTFELSISTVSAAQLLERAVADMAAYAEPFGVQVQVTATVPLDVPCDRQRVTQVLANLISNGIKHSPEGASVEVEASDAGDELRVQVRDHGRGVPESFVGELFTPFAQAESDDARRVEGTGLGLSITKAIVERHGGRIGYMPTDGGGATFWFTLPKTLDTDDADRPDHR